MRRSSASVFAMFLLYVGLLSAANGQEPAFISTVHAVRFEETTGLFDVVFPCTRSFLETPPADSTDPPSARVALCWMVRAVRLKSVNGKMQESAPAEGLLKISAALVSFEPIGPKVEELKDSVPTKYASSFKVPDGEMHLIGTPTLFFNFAFSTICNSCNADAKAFTPNSDQQAAEYQLIKESLSHFDDVAKRFRELTANTLVDIDPQNQPGADDDRAAWPLYAHLNQQLADRCPEPASSCARQYAVYQDCEAHAPGAPCGAAPSCSASCVLAPAAARDIAATACVSHEIGGATLIPDWTATLDAVDVSRPALRQSSPSAADEPPAQSASCTVKQGRADASLRRNSPSGVAGIALGGVMGIAPDASLAAPARTAVPNRPTRVSAGVIAGNIIEKVNPVYPTVAKAAHISGAVVLHAIISKYGTIENLTVVSGPDMLRASAVEAVRQWRYKPYLLLGDPVAVDTLITINFNFGVGPNAPAPASVPGATAPNPQP